MAGKAVYGMSSVDSTIFAVTVWRDGTQTAIACLPVGRNVEAWARDFCAKQNTDPDPEREARFAQKAHSIARWTAARFDFRFGNEKQKGGADGRA